MRRVQALWNILSARDRSVDVVGWWATWPAENVRGTIVSDHFAYHFLMEEGAAGAAGGAGKVSPPEAEKRLAPALKKPQDVTAEELSPFVSVTAEELARPFNFEDDLSHFKWAWATAETYTAIGLRLWKEDRPDNLLLYIEGLDSASHLFGHLFRAPELSGELAAQQKKYGHTVEAMYAYADKLLGRVMAAMDRNTTLLVLSDHGFELGKLQDDPSKTRDMRRVSEAFHRTEGILYMYGNRVKPRVRLNRPTILDIAPTVLALNGLGRAADMQGRVLAEALDLTIPAPVQSYEPAGAQSADATAPAAGTSDSQVDPEIVKKLQSLGYIGATSATGDRNLAAVAFEAGRFEEAAKEYARLVAEKPDDGSLRASHAGALGALGRYDAALAELTKAIELEPLNVEAYHNRAVIHERREEKATAVADYQTAVKYNPQYEPSRRALQRLGAPMPQEPRSDAEKRAVALAEEAAGAARRGDYAEAGRKLDEASRAAPGLPLLYQYRANVAYLRGDTRRGDRGARTGPEGGPWQRPLRREPQAPAADSDREPLKACVPATRTSRTPSEAWRSIGVAALPFAVYAAGACRTAFVGDSGDLLTAIAVLGIPHPSGYPLYVLLAKLWSAVFFFLPLPWSVSLFSAACAAAAAAVLYRGGPSVGRGRLRLHRSRLASRVRSELLGRGQHPARLCAQRALPGPRPALRASLAARPERPGPPRRGVRVRLRRLEPPRDGSRRDRDRDLRPRDRLEDPQALAARRRLRPRGARRTAALRLSPPPGPRASPSRLGAPGHPGKLRQGRAALRFLGPRLDPGPGGPRPDPGRLRAEPPRGVWPGSESRWRSSPSSRPGASAGLSCFPFSSCSPTRQRWRSTARAATSSSGTATTFPPTSRSRFWPRGAGRRSPRESARGSRRSPSFRRSSSPSRAGGPTTAAASRSVRTTRGLCSRLCRPAHT